MYGIEKFITLPRSSKRTSFSFSITDDSGDEEIWMIESSTKCRRERIAKLSSLENRTWCLRICMTRKTTRPTKIMDNRTHTIFSMFIIRIKIAKSSLYIEICEECRVTVTRSCDEQCFLLMSLSEEIEVEIDKINSRNCSPMSENTRLDMFFSQWFFEKKILSEIELRSANIICESKISFSSIDIVKRRRHKKKNKILNERSQK